MGEAVRWNIQATLLIAAGTAPDIHLVGLEQNEARQRQAGCARNGLRLAGGGGDFRIKRGVPARCRAPACWNRPKRSRANAHARRAE